MKNLGSYVYLNVVGFVLLFEEVVKISFILRVIFVLLLSVYGLNIKFLFSELDVIDSLALLYVVIKKVNEFLVCIYNYIYGVVLMVLCFFIVYGLYGRFDMVYYLFVNNIRVG